MQELCVKNYVPLEIELSGEIDSKNADEFETEVLKAYSKNPGDILFDCEKLRFIDSTTLGTFVKILKTVRKNGHTLKLVKTQPRIKKLFVICALDSVMEIES